MRKPFLEHAPKNIPTMKKLLTTLVLLLSFATAFAAHPVKTWGQLQVVGSQLCDKDGHPVVLRGVSFGWHNLWPRFYTKKTVKWLADDWHANVIRAAMGLQIEDNYLENPEHALRCISTVVDAAIRNDLYVIIDWHSHVLHTDEAKAFFGQMARKYGKYPNVIYELYNEPIEDSWDDLKAYASTVIAEIRKYDPDNIILMGCPHWDQDIDLPAKSPLTGVSNVMYTLHFYAATHKEYLRERLAAAVDGGLPVFVSECAGMEASGDGPLAPDEYQRWIDLLEAKKVSWVNWSISDKNETCSMILPSAKAEGKWTESQIKPWGQLVRNTLRKYNTVNAEK